MRPYFEKIGDFGRPLKEGQIKRTEENLELVKKTEAEVAQAVERAKNAGFPTEKINARGQMTVWQRLEYLVDPGTWCPLHTLFNPMDNEVGTTNVFDGLAKFPANGRLSSALITNTSPEPGFQARRKTF